MKLHKSFGVFLYSHLWCFLVVEINSMKLATGTSVFMQNRTHMPKCTDMVRSNVLA